eukprot:2310378-Amphidinium_carterae.1
MVLHGYDSRLLRTAIDYERLSVSRMSLSEALTIGRLCLPCLKGHSATTRITAGPAPSSFSRCCRFTFEQLHSAHLCAAHRIRRLLSHHCRRKSTSLRVCTHVPLHLCAAVCSVERMPKKANPKTTSEIIKTVHRSYK